MRTFVKLSGLDGAVDGLACSSNDGRSSIDAEHYSHSSLFTAAGAGGVLAVIAIASLPTCVCPASERA